MGFEWSAPKAQLSIFGIECEVEIGDAEMSDRVQRAVAKMQKVDFKALESDGKAYMAVSAELRGIIRSFVGQEAAESIFKGRKPNIVMEANMLAYVMEEINRANAEGESLNGALSRITALKTPIGDEE